jgi:hypothetical protein
MCVYELSGEVSAASPDTFPTGKVVGQFVTITSRCVCIVRLFCQTLVIRCNAAICDSSHCYGEIEDSRANGDGNAVLTRTIIRCISRTATRYGNAVDDGDPVFVIGWVSVTRVTHPDIAIQKRELEGFVLGAFEDTIRRVEPLE